METDEKKVTTEKPNEAPDRFTANNTMAMKTIKVLHKTMILPNAKHAHGTVMDYSDRAKNEIAEAGREQGYPVTFKEYPNTRELVAWIG